MYATRLHSFGPAENLRYESVPDPVAGPGEVRIAVKAVGVHFIETLFRRGIPVGPHPVPELPATFGAEVAGVVESVGEGVDPGLTGLRVVSAGVTSGGYASLAVAPAGSVTVLPDGLDHGVAVAMSVTGVTTLGLLEAAPVTASDVVLVMAAAGGVGTLLVRHARRVGATVVGAAGGPAKVSRVRALGANLAVDYNTPGWTEIVKKASIVFDGVGGGLGREAFGLLEQGGRQVVYGQASGEWFRPAEEELKERDITSYDGIGHLLGRAGGLADLRRRALEAAAEGVLTPEVQAFPLAQAAAAHAALESRNTMGKVILVP
ncbi:zinc-binding dehydrogenase [Nonomuraea rhizosphaerae]|uniref:zinc-binding dehydrogenase n=1 Tax=Nonomuraea rhizosphaerae TaxID=2665663 RepID=UPI001C5FEC8F|nr:zinc-binding dehydrogenase [Nonomuraea rhizosphaerae]